MQKHSLCHTRKHGAVPSESQSLRTGSGGAPKGIRTPNLLIRSQVLYPVELRAREQLCFLMVPELSTAVNLKNSRNS